MEIQQTDSELGRHLLTARGFHWIYGTGGDPYALTLRAESDDPPALARRIREEGALHRSATGAWVTGRHGTGAAVLADPRLGLRHHDLPGPQRHVFSDAWSDPRLCHVIPLDDAFLHLDGADHDRVARACAPVSGERAAERHRDLVERVQREIAEKLDDTFDLTADFARRAAVEVAAALLGVPGELRDRFARLCLDAAPALDAVLCPQPLPVTRRLLDAVAALRDLLGRLVATRRTTPGDDLLGTVLGAAPPGPAGEDDALAAGMLTAVVGVELTTVLIGNAFEALLAHPGQWQLLGDGERTAADAVEEVLRYAPPVRLESRVAAQDLELAGHEVPAGGQVVVHVGAANRDPEVYLAPDRFDITRAPKERHLSLAGPHTGFAGPLARLQAEVAVRTLRELRPGLESAGDAPRRMRSPVLGGFLRFPVTTAG
ncbi:P450-derived glycosyltransferase activator [Streptomyces sp. NPDC001678]|uniref:cytochrome P450 family protein n=1 Tax=Streptomyces sp. NPDC001678 TaxID=3364599 RepID=UPI003688E94C